MSNQLVVYAVYLEDADISGYFVKYSGRGTYFDRDVNLGKIWRKIGPARSMITTYTKNNPKATPLKLVKITSTEIEFIDESERVKKAIASEKNKKALHDERMAKLRLREAEERFEEAKRNLDKAKNTTF